MSEVILFEDSAPLRRILTMALRDAGFNVTSFENGVGSRDADITKQADLLITDVDMPVVDGHTVLANIRQSRPDMRTIVISGMTDKNLSGIDATAVLRKPFEPHELVATIEKVLA